MDVQRLRQSCPHKPARSSRKSHSHSRDMRSSAKEKSSPRKGKSRQKPRQVDMLRCENQKLRNENAVYQEYFAVFEGRMKEKDRENDRLRRKLKRLKEATKQRSVDKKIQRIDSTRCITEPYGHIYSRAVKRNESIGGHLSEYL